MLQNNWFMHQLCVRQKNIKKKKKKLCVRQDMKHLGRLESTQEARVALAWLCLEQLLHIFRALQTSCVLHISMNAY